MTPPNALSRTPSRPRQAARIALRLSKIEIGGQTSRERRGDSKGRDVDHAVVRRDDLRDACRGLSSRGSLARCRYHRSQSQGRGVRAFRRVELAWHPETGKTPRCELPPAKGQTPG